jgi:hypothetical protein
MLSPLSSLVMVDDVASLGCYATAYEECVCVYAWDNVQIQQMCNSKLVFTPLIDVTSSLPTAS